MCRALDAGQAIFREGVSLSVKRQHPFTIHPVEE